ncbi:MAG: hypothetical protein GC191_14965 [Azospirillum sp.]|nr:hypothetical protein [Azospirillum sp.]
MNVSATTSNSGATTGTSATSLESLGNDINQFLKLLTTQLQNQDPLNPMDNAEVTNQMIGYANVQQNSATNTRLDSLIALQKTGTAAGGLSYLGKQVEADGNLVEVSDGSGLLAYNLDATAASVLVRVVNSSGQTVFSANSTSTADVASGMHRVAWDAKDSEGDTLPDGTYSLYITALDASGAVIGSSTRATGTVTGVDVTGDDALLSLGTSTIKMTDVLAIH